MTDQKHKPAPDVNAYSHVKPWSTVARKTSIGQNHAPLPWVEAVGRAMLTPAETAVLAVIATHTTFNTWGGFRWCIAQVCRWAGYGRSTVKAALARLRELFLLRQDGNVTLDGVRRSDKTYRDVVVYRLAGVPSFPLPESVMRARHPESAAWDDQDQKPLTCKIDHKTKPHTPAPPPPTQTPVLNAHDHPRSVADEPSPYVTRARAERKGTKPQQRRPAATPEWIPPAVAAALTPGQMRRITAIAAAAMRRGGITMARLAARVGRWWTATAASGRRLRSVFGWLWHAVEARSYGCADPRCEDGDVWDGDRITGRCVGCAERRRDRAAAKRRGDALAAPWTAPWTPAWVMERADAHAALTAFVAAPNNHAVGIVRPNDSLREETGIPYASDQTWGRPPLMESP